MCVAGIVGVGDKDHHTYVGVVAMVLSNQLRGTVAVEAPVIEIVVEV
jgi:hypothetical protein